MHYASEVTLQRDSDGIDWSALVAVFKLAGLGGREGDKVRRAFEKSTIVCFARDGSKLVGQLAPSVILNITPRSMMSWFIPIIKGVLSAPG